MDFGKFWTQVKGKFTEVLSTEDIINAIQTRLDYYNERIEDLRKEIENYKNELWRNEELTRLKDDYEDKIARYSNGFGITKEENERISKWMKTLKKANTGAIGGRFEYRFHTTSIGDSGTVVDLITGEKFNFRELN